MTITKAVVSCVLFIFSFMGTSCESSRRTTLLKEQ